VREQGLRSVIAKWCTTVLKRTQQRAGQCSRTRSTPRRKSAHFCFLLHPPLCSAFICPARAGEASNIDRHLARGDETRKKRRELTEHLACSRVSKQSVLHKKETKKKERRKSWFFGFVWGLFGFRVCLGFCSREPVVGIQSLVREGSVKAPK